MKEWDLVFYYKDKVVYNQFGEGRIRFVAKDKEKASSWAAKLISEDDASIPDRWDWWSVTPRE